MGIRAFAIATGITVLVIASMEERYPRTGAGRYMLDPVKTNDLSFAKKTADIPGVSHIVLNALKKELDTPTDKRIGVVFSKKSGHRKEIFIRGTDIKLSSTEGYGTEAIVYTTGENGEAGRSCVSEIIGGYTTKPECRPLDEKDRGWIKAAAMQAGYGQDFVVADTPYIEPATSKISGAVRRIVQRNAYMEALRNQR